MSRIELVIVVFASLASLSWCAKEDVCGPAQKENADRIFSRNFIIGWDDLKAPTTLDEVKPFCSDFKATPRKLRTHIKSCYSSFSQLVASLVIKGVTKNYKTLCTKESRSQEFASRIKCFNANITFAHQCMNDFILDLQAIDKMSDSEKIPQVCCRFYHFRKCTLDTATACNETGRKEIAGFINRFVDDVLDLICSSTPEGNSKCTKPKFVRNESKKNSVGVLVPLLKVFSGLAAPN